MARTRKPHICFKCGTPTETTIQTKQKKGTTFICDAAPCWTAYYKEIT